MHGQKNIILVGYITHSTASLFITAGYEIDAKYFATIVN